MANLLALNITTPALLEEYVCEGTVNGVAQDFYPYCEFPYVNKGWGDDGEVGFEDVVMGDCTLKFGEAYASGYTMKRIIYGSINICTVLTTVRFLMIFQEKRKVSNAKKKTVNEQLCLLNLTICCAHLLICADMDSFFLFSVLFNEYASGMISLAIMLVSSWVTIVDGGKSKKTPPWVSKLALGSMVTAFTCEIILAALEIFVNTDSIGSFDGNMNAVKGFAFAIVLGIWAAVCIRYYLKISAQLKSGASSSGSKMIRKYCIVLLFCESLAMAYKVLFSILRIGKQDKETFCDAIDEFKRMGWFTGNEVRWSELLADMAVSVRQLAEIEVSEEEDLYLAGECCVSVRNIVEFFPDVSDAITLSQNIDVLRFFGGRRGFHVRAPTKSELGTSLLKRVAESLGLQGRVWDKTSTNFVKDIDMLQEALTTYNDIERDSGTGHKRLMKGHKCSEHDIGGEVRDINGCTHKTTWQNNHMTSHKATNHKTGGLVCGIDGCQHRTGNSMDMKRHKLSKHGFGPGHGRKRFHCDVPGCSSSYLRESRLRDHKAKKHSIGVTPDKVSCTVLGCSKTFCSKAEMVRHVKAKHSGGCNFSTSITSNLRRHKKNVHGM
ncbi:hypothetical protein TL16_g07448 [Triparma laevis f. inornata]|uniref:C2H2-type domain-containing protein n=1 Tax=Triparma laevis f. inornata TaxID=1714386 RepID=A0A9W7EG47_9STRA|nr:hypothetical protein TL16_g07448 [Triparma laevis f. inornata]